MRHEELETFSTADRQLVQHYMDGITVNYWVVNSLHQPMPIAFENPSEVFLSDGVTMEVSPATHVPGLVMCKYSDDRWSGLPENAFHRRNRESSCARLPERWNTGPGPLTLAPLYTPYVDRSTSEPTEGLTPETTPNAEKHKPDRGRRGLGIPEYQAAPCPQNHPTKHTTEREDYEELCCLVQEWEMVPRGSVCRATALASACKYISTFRYVVYKHSRLKPTGRKSNAGPMDERRIREEHKQMQELSRHYLLREDSEVWESAELLKEVLKDLKDHPPSRTPKWSDRLNSDLERLLA